MLPVVSFTDADPRTGYRGVVVAIGGPPDSGKSVFVAELYDQMSRMRSRGIYLERANPDGEGQWRRDSPGPVAQRLHKRAEQKFGEEFFARLMVGLPGLVRTYSTLLLDLGGMRSVQNAELLRHATHGIIVSKNQKKLNEWRKFMTENGCLPAATLLTELRHGPDGVTDLEARSSITLTVEPVTGMLVNLVRGMPADAYADAVEALARWLLMGR